jgi:hypothetical protein
MSKQYLSIMYLYPIFLQDVFIIWNYDTVISMRNLDCLFYVLLTLHLDICLNETNLTHYLCSVYSVTIFLHVSGLLVAHHEEVILYIWDKWYVVCLCRLSAGPDWNGKSSIPPRPANCRLRRTKRNNCHIHTYTHIYRHTYRHTYRHIYRHIYIHTYTHNESCKRPYIAKYLRAFTTLINSIVFDKLS